MKKNYLLLSLLLMTFLSCSKEDSDSNTNNSDKSSLNFTLYDYPQFVPFALLSYI